MSRGCLATLPLVWLGVAASPPCPPFAAHLTGRAETAALAAVVLGALAMWLVRKRTAVSPVIGCAALAAVVSVCDGLAGAVLAGLPAVYAALLLFAHLPLGRALAVMAAVGGVHAIVAVAGWDRVAPQSDVAVLMARAGWLAAVLGLIVTLVRAARDYIAASEADHAAAAAEIAEVAREAAARAAQLARTEASLRAAQRTTDGFLAQTGHELRTPLHAISGLAHLALRTELSTRQRDYLDKISQAAAGLTGVLNNVIDLSHCNEQLKLDCLPFELDHVITNVAGIVRMVADERGIELVFAVDPRAPRCLVGDARRLGQALYNLSSHAANRIEGGSLTLCATLVGEVESGQVRLRYEVIDTGPARCVVERAGLGGDLGGDVPAEGAAHVGLRAAQRLIEAMGGTLAISPADGAAGGNRYGFELCADVAARPGRMASSALMSVAQRVRALVVDDNASARLALRDMLAGWQFEVTAVANGPAALLELRGACEVGQPFGLVLLDWRMPIMDGVEVARIVLSDPATYSVPHIVAATAYASGSGADLLRSVGVEVVLAKPVTPSALFDSLARIFVAQAEDGSGHETLEDRARGHLAGAQVLLAEDNEINQMVAIELLEAVGVRVRVANDGSEALRRITASTDAILMDLQMPGLDGYGATRELLSRPDTRHIPIIALTANSVAEERDRVLAAGMKDFVAKPIEPALLYEALIRWVAPQRAASAPLGRAASAAMRPPSWPHSDNFSVGELGGFDVQGALRRHDGNQALLRRLLERFVATQQGTVARIATLAESGDRESAVREAHTLNGLSANLGADAVADAARDVEHALKAQAPHEALMDRLERSLALALAAAARAVRVSAPVESAPPQPTAAIELPHADLAALRALVAESETDAADYCAHLIARGPSAHWRAVLAEVRDQCQSYEFEAALTELDSALGETAPPSA